MSILEEADEIARLVRESIARMDRKEQARRRTMERLMGWNRLPARIPAPDIIPAADQAEPVREQAAWLGAHYQEHRRIEVIPALGEAVAFSVCPDCRRWERAERVYASGGDEARAAVLMEVWR